MYLPATTTTPEVDFRLADGKTLWLRGPCSPDNPSHFFDDVKNGAGGERGLWGILLDRQAEDAPVDLRIDLYTVNSGSELQLKEIFEKIDESYSKIIKVYWADTPDDRNSRRIGAQFAGLFGSFFFIVL